MNSNHQTRDWHARWIWNSDSPGRNAWCLFRKTFSVQAAGSFRLHISADTRYRVWVNGTLLGDGPPQSQPYHQFYDSRDVSAAVVEGENCVAVLVHHQGLQQNTRGGLLAEIADEQDNIVCATNAEWRTVVGAAWRSNTLISHGNKIGPFQEHVDYRRLPSGWQCTGTMTEIGVMLMWSVFEEPIRRVW